MDDLTTPYLCFWFLLGLALVNLWRKRRETRWRLALATAAFAGLSVFSTPLVAYLALGSLEWRYPPGRQRPAEAEAIVVLAGGVTVPTPSFPSPELNANTIYRCLHAAELYHQGPPCPVLVSGGKARPEATVPPSARLMQDFLVRLGVRPADVLVEDGSQTTYENAVESRRLLERHGIRKVVLVTEASHMRRASACFRKQGVEVVPSACHHLARGEWECSVADLLPNPGAAHNCQCVTHEWLGLGWYWLTGKI